MITMVWCSARNSNGRNLNVHWRGQPQRIIVKINSLKVWIIRDDNVHLSTWITSCTLIAIINHGHNKPTCLHVQPLHAATPSNHPSMNTSKYDYAARAASRIRQFIYTHCNYIRSLATWWFGHRCDHFHLAVGSSSSYLWWVMAMHRLRWHAARKSYSFPNKSNCCH